MRLVPARALYREICKTRVCPREKKGLRDSETRSYLMGVDKASETIVMHSRV